MKRIICLLLAAVCALGLLAGCNEVVSDIADNVLAAAKDELINQIKEKVEQYKVTVKETKAAVGTLNDEGGKHQFYCAILVQTNEESSAKDCADALGKVFGESGYMAQADSKVESDHLVHKTISYNTTDYSAGNYYTVYVYVSDITKIVDMNAIQDAISGAIGKEST